MYTIEGESKSIACNAFGNPFPEVQWFLKDVAVTESHLNVSVLQLTDINRKVHRREYKCKALSKSLTYGFLESERTIEISVYCKFIPYKDYIN